ncbi:FAD-dependent oxidoreductase [Massilia sp. Se16.2.3]|uniref:FAD-dependent oxidoreductase n=1 Tax=Massilia sp. Se16.2.3 TaxID=2709303 RepID=UPI0028059551|nr:FAD-dependent oxidoreductase [Massilia sp. Se16.2.3]
MRTHGALSWQRGWRAGLPALLGREWDILIVGGGITGAGILLEASRRGLSALLVEAHDFAWGTSSRSSKLVHGGLRYLAQGHLGLTREAVREREALLRDAPGLVERRGFAFPDYGSSPKKRRTMLAGLALYDLFAGRREPHWLDAADFALLAPNTVRAGLQGGVIYTDAKTDDARLVLRTLGEARRHGGVAVNHLAVQSPVSDSGRVAGARLRDAVAGNDYEVRARLVIDAGGVWAGRLDSSTGKAPRLRPLRGSHLVLPAWRLPLAQAISLMHQATAAPCSPFPGRARPWSAPPTSTTATAWSGKRSSRAPKSIT